MMMMILGERFEEKVGRKEESEALDMISNLCSAQRVEAQKPNERQKAGYLYGNLHFYLSKLN